MAFMRLTMSSDSSTLVLRLRRLPWRRMVGWRPTVRWRSEAPSLTTVSSRRSICIVDMGQFLGRCGGGVRLVDWRGLVVDVNLCGGCNLGGGRRARQDLELAIPDEGTHAVGQGGPPEL